MLRWKPKDLAVKIEPYLIELGKNQNVPSKRALAEKFDADPRTVAKSLELLLGKDLIAPNYNLHFIILEPIDPSDDKQIIECMRTRLCLEPYATELATLAYKAEPTSSRAATLRKAYNALREANERNNNNDWKHVEQEIRADGRFHASIHDLCPQRDVYSMLSHRRHSMMSNVDNVVTRLHKNTEYRIQTQIDHDEIYSEINDGNASKASEAMRRHLANALKLMGEDKK